jgi:hypothetical protein
MKKYVLFITIFLIFNSLLFAELTRAQMWAISLTGIMTEINSSNRNTLHASTMDERGRNTWLTVLRRDWGITTREQLLETLERMENGGHAASFREIQQIISEVNSVSTEAETVAVLARYTWDQTKLNRFNYTWNNWHQYHNRTIKAWDLGRNISLCRWGYNVGFITEDEAWKKIMYYASLIQSLYSSWEEYGYDYYMGRIFWASGFREEESYLASTEPVYRRLINSYWGGWLDWYIDLDQPETSVPVNTIRFLRPNDNDGSAQYWNNDPALYDMSSFHYMQNRNADPDVFECRVKKISGRDTNGYGMLFCVDNTGSNNVSFYRLSISVNGRFHVQKRVVGTWTTMLSWRNSSFLITGYNVYNTLRVVRTDNKDGDGASFKIFLNGNYAAIFDDDSPLKGSRIGMTASTDVMEKEQFPHIPVDIRYEY